MGIEIEVGVEIDRLFPSPSPGDMEIEIEVVVMVMVMVVVVVEIGVERRHSSSWRESNIILIQNKFQFLSILLKTVKSGCFLLFLNKKYYKIIIKYYV